jgi:23S rRNA pseudouridine955/2504/2580 synthase
MNPIPIIYQNQEIFIINKKAGMPVQGGEKIAHSLDEELAKQVGQKVYLVHRLDKDTSGLMIVAKTPQAANKWTKLIGSKEVKKEYIAVCAGSLKQKKGQITEDIIQHGQSKKAVTHYQVEKEWQIEREEDEAIQMCQIRLQLETGRMHQIRIHLAKQGCPIAGDDQHGNFKINKILRKIAGIKHLQLFSAKLTIPLDGKDESFQIDYSTYNR